MREILHLQGKGHRWKLIRTPFGALNSPEIYYLSLQLRQPLAALILMTQAEQRGIVHLLSEQNGKLLEVLDEMGGKAGFSNED